MHNKIVDSVGWDGIVTLIAKSSEGKILRVKKIHNTVTAYALNYITNIFANGILNDVQKIFLPTEMELGTGTGAPSQNDTDLFKPAPATLRRVDYAQPYALNYVQYVKTWQTGDNIQGTWTEAGLKDANGNLWAHVILGNYVVISGETLTIEWQIQFVGGQA